MHDKPALAEPTGQGFHPVRLVLIVLAVLLLVSVSSNWYIGRASLPRYCQHTELVLHRLAEIITENRPAGDQALRDYIVTAKLEFIVPRTSDEPLDAYLLRLRHHLGQLCD